MDKQSKRRSSILKPQKPRNPLSDLDFVEPTEELPTNLKVVNRRVSFASRSLVKEYVRDAETNALCWNSTYEEQINKSDSVHLPENTDTCLTKPNQYNQVHIITNECDGENVAGASLVAVNQEFSSVISNNIGGIQNLLYDKENLPYVNSNTTSVANDKTILDNCSMELTQNIGQDDESMELTEVLPVNQIINSAPIMLSKNRTYNKTIIGNESMECTYAIEPNLIVNKAKVIRNVEMSQNICVGKKNFDATNIGDLSMELTQQVPIYYPNATYKTCSNKTILKNESMKMTQMIPNVYLEAPKENYVNERVDVSMEFTEAVPIHQSPLVNKKSFSTECNATLRNVLDMEFTQQFHAQNLKVTSESKIINESMELTGELPCLEVSSNPLQVNDIEFMQLLSTEHSKVTSKSKIGSESMELTRARLCQDQKLAGHSDQYNTTQRNYVSMEFTNQVHALNPKVTNKSKIGNECMKLTGDPEVSERSNWISTTQKNYLSMEFTQQAQALIPKSTNKSVVSNESMELTRGLPCQDERVLGSSDQYNATQRNDVRLEFTQQLPTQNSKATNKSKLGNESMELTRGLPCQDKKLPGSSDQYNATQSNDVSMEFTQQLPTQNSKATNKSKLCNESMELTRGLPCQDKKLPGSSDQYNATQRNDVSMEFTQQLPTQNSKATNKSKLCNESMELTRGLPCQDERLLGSSDQYNATQKNDVSMEFTQQLPTQNSKATNKSKLGNESMELTRGLLCQDKKLPGSSDQYNATQRDDVSMEFTQQLPTQNPSLKNKSKVNNESVKLTGLLEHLESSNLHNPTQRNYMHMEVVQHSPSQIPKLAVKSKIINTNIQLTKELPSRKQKHATTSEICSVVQTTGTTSECTQEMATLSVELGNKANMKKETHKHKNLKTNSNNSDSNEININPSLPNYNVKEAAITEPIKQSFNDKLNGSLKIITKSENVNTGANEAVLTICNEDFINKEIKQLCSQINDNIVAEENKKEIKTKGTDKKVCSSKGESNKTSLGMKTRSKVTKLPKAVEEIKSNETQNDKHKKIKSKAKKKELINNVASDLKQTNAFDLTKLQVAEKGSNNELNKDGHNLLKGPEEINVENIHISRLRTPHSSFHMNLTTFSPFIDDTQHLINYPIGSAQSSAAKSDKKNTFIISDVKSLKRQSSEAVDSNKPTKRALWANVILNSSIENEIDIEIAKTELFSNKINQSITSTLSTDIVDDTSLKRKEIWENFLKQDYFKSNLDDFKRQQEIYNETIRKCLKVRKKQCDELVRAVLEPYKVPVVEIPMPSLDTSFDPCLDSMESQEERDSPMKVDDILSVQQKILEKEESCDGYWNLIFLKDDACEFTTLFKTVRIGVDFNKENGVVCETDVQYSISYKSDRIGLLAHRSFKKLLLKENIEAAIGEQYEILSLLDYVYMNMDKTLCFLRDMKKLHRFNLIIDDSFRAHFKIASIRLKFVWSISVDLADLDSVSKNSVTTVAEIGTLQKDKIEMCANNCLKGMEFLKCFIDNIIAYVNSLMKPRTNN